VSADITKVFQVGCADFCAIWRVDDSMRWDANCVVREAGVFIPPPKRAYILMLAELVAISHPTGDHNEPVLPFPCTLEQMMELASDRGTGDCSNRRLVAWMSARVENLRHMSAWMTLNTVADQLFQVDREDAIRLLPHADPSHHFPTFPCSLDALLQWCEDDTEEGHRIAQPSNEGIVRLIKGRLTRSGLPSESSTPELRTHQRTSRVNIILALNGDRDVDWDRKTKQELHQAIVTQCEANHIPLGKGKGGTDSIARAVVAAAELETPLITCATPKKDAIGNILKEIREEQKAT
jgi:hypothetical protein